MRVIGEGGGEGDGEGEGESGGEVDLHRLRLSGVKQDTRWR